MFGRSQMFWTQTMTLREFYFYLVGHNWAVAVKLLQFDTDVERLFYQKLVEYRDSKDKIDEEESTSWS